MDNPQSKKMTRRYHRGGNRLKHVGKTDKPLAEKKTDGEIIGKCPQNFPDTRKQAMLIDAVPYLTTPPYSLAFPKRLYAVDNDGTIYTAQTSNPGDSYHGYPYAGRMGKHLIAALRKKAQTKGCEEPFNIWLKNHITVGGPPDL